jgi:hypothetical protein
VWGQRERERKILQLEPRALGMIGRLSPSFYIHTKMPSILLAVAKG